MTMRQDELGNWYDDGESETPVTPVVVDPPSDPVTPPTDLPAEIPERDSTPSPLTPGGLDNPTEVGQGWTQDELGNFYKIDASGNVAFKDSKGTEFTYDTTKGGFVDSKGNLAGDDSGLMGFIKKGGQQLLDLFKGKDGKVDWKRLLSVGAGLYSATRPSGSAGIATGYQGTIPKYTAERQMLTNPQVGRRPGSSGIDYGGGVTFKNAAGEVVQSNARTLDDLRAAALANPFSRKATYETPSVSGSASRAQVLDAYKNNPLAVLTPDETAIQYWMNKGLDTFGDTVKSVRAADPKLASEIDLARSGAATPPVASADITNWFNTNKGASDKTIATAMDANLVTPKQVAEALNVSPDVVTSRYNATKFAKGGIAEGLERNGFVLPADVVSHYGNGSSEAGLKLLAENLGAKPIKGAGDGMSDSIPTTIDGSQEARVANDEAFISPAMVKRIGGGSAEKGAKKLYAMMDSIRQARTGSTEQGKQIDPNKFMPGGSVQRYDAGGVTTTTPKVPAGTTGVESSLSNWAGEYVTDLMGRGSALAKAPYQAYTGPLTAGASGLQTQAFDMASGARPSGLTSALSGLADYAPTGGGGANASNVSSTYVAPEAYKPGTFSTGTFGTAEAQQYMNPYLKSALDPQLAEARRQAEISRIGDAGRLTKAGAFGGSRQAIMEAEGSRNLMGKQNELLTSGYNTAYNKAMDQFNADQLRALDVQKATEQAGQFGYGQSSDQAKTAADLALRASTSNQSAALTASQINSAAASAADANRLQALTSQGNLGLSQLNQLTALGGIERGIESEGIAADKKQFEEARENPFKMLQFEQSLLSGMPLQSQSYSAAARSALQKFSDGTLTADQAMRILLGETPATTK